MMKKEYQIKKLRKNAVELSIIFDIKCTGFFKNMNCNVID